MCVYRLGLLFKVITKDVSIDHFLKVKKYKKFSNNYLFTKYICVYNISIPLFSQSNSYESSAMHNDECMTRYLRLFLLSSDSEVYATGLSSSGHPTGFKC